MPFYKFIADTVDQKILEFPKEYYLNCGEAKPIGYQTVRNYDNNECIVARNVFLIMYRGQLLGSTAFRTTDDFINYQNSNCYQRGTCLLTINGCYALVNGCGLND